MQQSQGQQVDHLLVSNVYKCFLECHINLSLCQIRLYKFEDAVSSLTAILVYAPQSGQAYYLRGKAFLCLNEYKMALGDLSKARDLVTDHQKAHVEEMLRELTF